MLRRAEPMCRTGASGKKEKEKYYFKTFNLLLLLLLLQMSASVCSDETMFYMWDPAVYRSIFRSKQAEPLWAFDSFKSFLSPLAACRKSFLLFGDKHEIHCCSTRLCIGVFLARCCQSLDTAIYNSLTRKAACFFSPNRLHGMQTWSTPSCARIIFKQTKRPAKQTLIITIRHN